MPSEVDEMDLDETILNECNCNASVDYKQFIEAFSSCRDINELNDVVEIMKENKQSTKILEESMKSDEKGAEKQPPKSKNKKSREDWRKMLKKSVVINQIPDTELSNPEKLIEQLKEAVIESNKKTEVYVKCMIGRNLVLIQKMKKKGAVFMTFLKKHITSYSPSIIYFLMKLYNLAQDYHRLMYVTLGIGVIGVLKSNFKLIAELIAEEPDYWKNLA